MNSNAPKSILIFIDTDDRPTSILNRLTLSQDPLQIWNFLQPKLTSPDPATEQLYRSLGLYLDVTQVPTENILIVDLSLGYAKDLTSSRYPRISLHGQVQSSSCMKCPWFGSTASTIECPVSGRICPECSAVCRPDIVLYREGINLTHSEQIHRFLQQQKRGDITLVVGLGSNDIPFTVRSWINTSARRGAKVTHINNDPIYNQPYWSPFPNRRRGEYRLTVGSKECWLHANPTSGLELLASNIRYLTIPTGSTETEIDRM
jgi:NAD-dependent SIR2 family protein deacetylase